MSGPVRLADSVASGQSTVRYSTPAARSPLPMTEGHALTLRKRPPPRTVPLGRGALVGGASRCAKHPTLGMRDPSAREIAASLPGESGGVAEVEADEGDEESGQGERGSGGP